MSNPSDPQAEFRLGPAIERVMMLNTKPGRQRFDALMAALSPEFSRLEAEAAAARELLAAIVEALEVPVPADISPRGDVEWLRALRDRAGHLRGFLRPISEGRLDSRLAARLRADVEQFFPIRYKPFRPEPLPPGITARLDGGTWMWECSEHGRSFGDFATEADAIYGAHGHIQGARCRPPAPSPEQVRADLVARAEAVRDGLVASDLPRASEWEVTDPSLDWVMGHIDPTRMLMLSGFLYSPADLAAYAARWGVATHAEPSPRYLSTRTVIDGIGVEVWARTTDGDAR